MLARLRRALAGEDLPGHRRILAGVVAVGAATLGVYAVAAAKDLVVAARFGTSDGLDAFLVALLVMMLVVNTCVASLADSFLPVYVRVRAHHGVEDAGKLLRSAMTFDGLCLLVISIVLGLAVPYVIPFLARGFDPTKLALTERLLYVLLPALVLSGFSAPCSAALNAAGNYLPVALAPMLTPGLTIVLLLLMPVVADPGILAIGVLVGKVGEIVFLVSQLRGHGVSVLPGPVRLDDGMRQILHQAIPLVVGGFVATSGNVIDQAVAAGLSSGAVSSLNYGTRITAVLVGIGSIAVTNVIFPRLSHLFALRSNRRLLDEVTHYCLIAFVLGSVVTLLVALLSEPLIQLIFQRGAFTYEDTLSVAQIQTLFVLQTPFHVAGMVLVRLLSVFRMNYLILAIGSLAAVVNLIGDVLLANVLGVPGIALATSVVFVFTFGLLVGSAYAATRKQVYS